MAPVKNDSGTVQKVGCVGVMPCFHRLHWSLHREPPSAAFTASCFCTVHLPLGLDMYLNHKDIVIPQPQLTERLYSYIHVCSKRGHLMWFVCYRWICCEYTSMSLVWVVGVCCIILKVGRGKKGCVKPWFPLVLGPGWFLMRGNRAMGICAAIRSGQVVFALPWQVQPSCVFVEGQRLCPLDNYLPAVNRCPSVTWPKFPQRVNQRECREVLLACLLRRLKDWVLVTQESHDPILESATMVPKDPGFPLFQVYWAHFPDLFSRSLGSSSHCAFMLCDFLSYSSVRVLIGNSNKTKLVYFEKFLKYKQALKVSIGIGAGTILEKNMIEVVPAKPENFLFLKYISRRTCSWVVNRWGR